MTGDAVEQAMSLPSPYEGNEGVAWRMGWLAGRTAPPSNAQVDAASRIPEMRGLRRLVRSILMAARDAVAPRLGGRCDA